MPERECPGPGSPDALVNKAIMPLCRAPGSEPGASDPQWWTASAIVRPVPVPLVSAAVITYNQRKYVEAALGSVLAQTYPHIEIIVGDDGSTDGTPDVLRRLQQRYPDRIGLALSPVNRGITANCNAVLAQSRGEYVAWLGGDDEWLPEKLSRQVKDLEAHPHASLSHHAVEMFFEGTGEVRVLDENPLRHPSVTELVSHCFINGSSVLHRRSAAPPHGFRSELQHGSDWLFYIETAMSGGLVRTPGVLGRYRQHAEQVTHPLAPYRAVVVSDYRRSLKRLSATYPELRKPVRKGLMTLWIWEFGVQRSAGTPLTVQVRALARAVAANPSPRELRQPLQNVLVRVLREHIERLRRR